MNAPIFTPEEQANLEARAHQRGFAELRAYLYALVEQDTKTQSQEDEHRPTLDELMEMPPEERDYWLEKAAAIAEEFYRNDPELTITADTIDLYDYPDTE